jgi:dihydropteroate synthase
LVKAVRQAFPQAKISVDTSSPDLMKACLDEGVWMINDVRALTRPGAIEVCAGYDANLCLMHMQGEPQTMQQGPAYGDLVTEVEKGLMQRVLACREAGIAAERIWLDPGFGFGKSLAHNYQLLAQLKRIAALGFPLLIGVSRKSMIGQVLPELSPSERDVGSLAAALWAFEQGAGLLRVHNVKMMKEGLAVWQMIQAHKE